MMDLSRPTWQEGTTIWLTDEGDNEIVTTGSPRDLALQAKRDQREAAERDYDETRDPV